MKEIVLASSSPRRRQLLEGIGLEFKVDATYSPEDLETGLDAAEMARKLSLDKAKLAAARNPNAIVIAADTIGVLEGQIIGKPNTEDDARNMLRRMQGKCHTVITGYSIIDSDTLLTVTRSVETKVCFRELSQADIEAYVHTGEPMDKAGAYGIQGLGALLVERIDGDYFNVIGLPLSDLAQALKRFGINLLQAKAASDNV